VSAQCRHIARPSVYIYPTLTLTVTFELLNEKNNSPVTPALRDVHTDFGFSVPLTVELGARTGRTDKTLVAAYRTAAQQVRTVGVALGDFAGAE